MKGNFAKAVSADLKQETYQSVFAREAWDGECFGPDSSDFLLEKALDIELLGEETTNHMT